MILCSDSFKKFLETLSAEQITPKISARALSCVADELEIGRVDLQLRVPRNRNLPKGDDRDATFYEWEGGADEEVYYDYEQLTGDGGTFRFRFYGRKGQDTFWGDEAIQDLRVIAEIYQLHSARFRLASMIQNAYLTQYLTGLPNSGGYLRFVGERFARGEIAKYDAYYFNIKGMSLYNVKFGQREGDEIIKRYALMLNDTLGENEIMGHLGGDNFTAMVLKENSAAFEKLLAGAETYAVRQGEKVPICVSATAGVMRMNEKAAGPWMVMTGPSVALQNARMMSAPIIVLTDEMMERSNRVQQVENAFHDAIKNDQFHPFYQPKVNMLTGEIVGAEVLSRWIVNDRIVPPMEFIPILERTGEIVELDLYMMDRACRNMSDWRASGKKTIPLSINVSRRDLELPDLSERIIDCFDRYALDHGDVIIEVTETESAREGARMKSFLYELTSAGIKTSIDDFGTGYSSLSFLRDFPVSEIKIDRSFINHEQLREKDRIIIGSIIDMAVRLGIDVITEGVEITDQVDFLLDLNCSRAQGFLFDRPLPREDFERRLLTGPYKI